MYKLNREDLILVSWISTLLNQRALFPSECKEKTKKKTKNKAMHHFSHDLLKFSKFLLNLEIMSLHMMQIFV